MNTSFIIGLFIGFGVLATVNIINGIKNNKIKKDKQFKEFLLETMESFEKSIKASENKCLDFEKAKTDIIDKAYKIAEQANSMAKKPNEKYLTALVMRDIGNLRNSK